jgi:predicted nucleotidyltransferase
MNKANKYSQDVIALVSKERHDLNNLNPAISIPVREFVRQMLHLDIRQIYLFGSVVKEQYKESSDIDIALVTHLTLDTKSRLAIEEAASSLEKRFGREIEIHYFTGEQFELGIRKRNPLVEEILRDGIRLLG